MKGVCRGEVARSSFLGALFASFTLFIDSCQHFGHVLYLFKKFA